MIHIQSLMCYVGSSNCIIDRLNGHFTAFLIGTDTSRVMQGVCYLFDHPSDTAGFLAFPLKYHIPITNTMTAEQLAYATENNLYPTDWEEICREGNVDPTTIDQSKSYLSHTHTVLLKEVEKRCIQQWNTGFIIVDNTITSNLANVDFNVDRPGKRQNFAGTRLPSTPFAIMGDQKNLNYYSLQNTTQQLFTDSSR